MPQPANYIKPSTAAPTAAYYNVDTQIQLIGMLVEDLWFSYERISRQGTNIWSWLGMIMKRKEELVLFGAVLKISSRLETYSRNDAAWCAVFDYL